MTVCIAAIANDKSIVTASDSKVSIGYSSADANTVKYEEFHDNWVVMMAVEDVSHFIPIRDLSSANMDGRPKTLSSALSALTLAYKEHLSQVAADRVLAHFNMDMKEFKKQGTKTFSSDVYGTLCDLIAKVKLDCIFLAYGYDKNKHPHIFTVRHPGTAEVYDKPVFGQLEVGKHPLWACFFN